MITDDTVKAADEWLIPNGPNPPKLNKKQRLVYDVIMDYPEAANDDAVLLANVWLREGWMGGAMVLEECLRRVSRPETLSRRRRELFNLGLIEYSDKASKRRTKAFISERDRASPLPPALKALKPFSEMINSKPPVTPEQERLV